MCGTRMHLLRLCSSKVGYVTVLFLRPNIPFKCVYGFVVKTRLNLVQPCPFVVIHILLFQCALL